MVKKSAAGSTFVRPFLGDELAVPAKDGVGSDERRDLGERPSSDYFAPHGKPSPLRIGQSKSLAPGLLLQHPVLFPI